MRILFQDRVARWARECFQWKAVPQRDPQRVHRFIEEALELAQACDIAEAEVLALVKYVYGRPTGEVRQEVGGVLMTLAILCTSAGIDMVNAGEDELERCWMNIHAIRAKQASKKNYASPLPGGAD